MSTTWIGFGYKARMGKDLAVQAIIDNYKDRYDVRRYAFADALKIQLFDALCDQTHPFWAFLKSRGVDVQFYLKVKDAPTTD